jgi:DNA (cytosine-5)-methyltransferase 1
VAVALNHWSLAIETHNTNFPETIHDCTDISACDPRRYPSTDILITSPECTNHSVAKGKKAVTAQLDLFNNGILDPACERSRATMWDVPRFAEYHKYNIIIVENVVDARKWVQFPAWLMAMDLLGYNHKAVYANSMHFQPTPQSRDRMYVVFWKKGNTVPDLELKPKAYCQCCNSIVESVQAWKNPQKKFGKYKQQYVYVCPTCVSRVEPFYHAAFNIIDWSNIGTRIGDRSKPLSENTQRRIKYGLDKYGKEPLLFHTAYGKEARGIVKDMNSPAFTQTTFNSMAMAVPMVIKGEHTQVDGMVKPVTDSINTHCTRQTMSLCVPFIINNQQKTGISFRVKSAKDVVPTQSTASSFSLAVPPPFMVENKGTSNAREITSPAATLTTVPHLGIITNEAWKSFIHYHYGQTTLSDITDALGTATTKDRHSLVSYQEPKYEDCFYRMLMPSEIQAAMAFDADYVVLGSGKDKVKQLGNAVTPPAMEWLVQRCVESLEN